MTTSKKRQWTIMVYMAGDTGAIIEGNGGARRLWSPLENEGYQNLEQLESVGSTNEVAIVVQFDDYSSASTLRRIITPLGKLSQEEIIPNQNMGSPKTLTDFIVWGITNAPAEQIAVILWGHGTGWKEEDIYAFARQKGAEKLKQEVRSTPKWKKLTASLFFSSIMPILALPDQKKRGVCFDDASLDFLNNADLKQAFYQAEKQTGQKVSLIGMDACLMGMLEVAYQLRHHSQVMIASQEVAPLYGWPYQAILQGLTKRPTMSPKELGQLIVQEVKQHFKAHRGFGPRMTLSAVDLTQMGTLSSALKPLTAELCQGLEQKDFYLDKRAIPLARKRVQKFRDKEYVDLHHFLTQLQQEYQYVGRNSQLKEELTNTLNLLNPQRPNPLVLANFVWGKKADGANGLSIYLPKKKCSLFYKELDFEEVGWGKFVRRLNGVESWDKKGAK